MFKDIRVIIIVGCAALSLAVSLLIFSLRTASISTRLSEESRLTKVLISKDKVTEELSRAKQDIEGIRGNIGRLQKEASSLEMEVATRKKKIDSIRARLRDTEQESLQANQKIEQTVLSIDELRSRIADVVRDTLQMREELVLLEKTKTALESRYEQYAEAAAPIGAGYARENVIPEPKEQESRAQAEPATQEAVAGPKMEGEVLTVNREFDFVVVSLGKNDGITEGMVFDVLRDGAVLGQVEIETVRANISAASLINSDYISQMRAGDRVHPAFPG